MWRSLSWAATSVSLLQGTTIEKCRRERWWVFLWTWSLAAVCTWLSWSEKLSETRCLTLIWWRFYSFGRDSDAKSIARKDRMWSMLCNCQTRQALHSSLYCLVTSSRYIVVSNQMNWKHGQLDFVRIIQRQHLNYVAGMTGTQSGRQETESATFNVLLSLHEHVKSL